LVIEIIKMKKIIFYILWLIKFNKFLSIIKVNKKEIITLMFHRINYETDSLWPSMRPDNFEKLIKLLKNHTKIISINEIFSNKIREIKLPIVIISFDDGYKDFIKFAMPILLKYNIPAHINICPGLIEKKTIPWTQLVNYFLINSNKQLLNLFKKFKIEHTNNINEFEFNKICHKINSLTPSNYEFLIEEIYKIDNNFPNLLMDWDEIYLCYKNNFLIGCHSMTHKNLDKITGKEKIIFEIIESQSVIEEKIASKINIFSFPNGYYNNEVLKITKQNYKYLLLCEDKNTIISNPKDHYILPRINIARNDYREEFLRSLGFHQFLKKIFKKDYIIHQ